jgi:uncharacterized protein YgiM (DUF1202 family)
MPSFPAMPLMSTALLILVTTLSVYKWRDSFTARATITTVKASVKSLPADEGVNLYDISGGSEVFVRQAQNGWVQVQNSDGTSGWVKNSELLITSER